MPGNETEITMTDSVTILMPDDWHLHLRDGAVLNAVLPDSSRYMARAIIMPNLKPPVTTTSQAAAYRERILAAKPVHSVFEPLMTLYLTDNTLPTEITVAKDSGFVHAVKLYPAGATTNSDAGVTQISKVMSVLEKMAELGMPLLMHGEVTDAETDIFDREAVFIDSVLIPLRKALPELKIVFEHITTQQAAKYVAEDDSSMLAATVTPHHLLMNRNAILEGGIHPHHYCLPVLKRERHRQALLEAVTGRQSHKFFLGTDSAPHLRQAKESSCGCAGLYSARHALAFYAEAFDSVGALDKLEDFTSQNGPDFYRLPVNTKTLTLVKQPQKIDSVFFCGTDEIVPMRASGETAWRILDE